LTEKRGIKTINKKVVKQSVDVLDTENNAPIVNESEQAELISIFNKKISKHDNNGQKKAFATKKKLTSKSSKESKPRRAKTNIMNVEASKEFFDNSERNSSIKRNLIC